MGNGLAKWHAQWWPGATSRISGFSREQISWAMGQGGRKRQPLGGSMGLGGSPARMMRSRLRCTSGSGTGTADRSAWV